jgi:hypothetical protein
MPDRGTKSEGTPRRSYRIGAAGIFSRFLGALLEGKEKPPFPSISPPVPRMLNLPVALTSALTVMSSSE